MVLVEREEIMAALQQCFEKVKHGEGHCVLLSGEAGIGKSSLVRAFCNTMADNATILQGMCDALFTPRPLAPLYDIALQSDGLLPLQNAGAEDRALLFTNFLNHILHIKGPCIMVFEDVHWADEATIDFIKFFARRIARTRCLFILTYRDDEIHTWHPLTSLLGQLPPGSFTRLQPSLLSRAAVEKMSLEKGYNAVNVYGISGGNPFYVTEILANYSPGLPANIKDAVTAVYNRQKEETKRVWDALSIAPSGLEPEYLEQVLPGYVSDIAQSLAAKILLVQNGRIYFKHELYRRAVEENLSALGRASLNKKFLLLFLKSFTEKDQTERTIHHAKEAGDNALVVQYGPVAAVKAAAVGAHAEACRLYMTVIEHYTGDDENTKAGFYSAYAYECYLTNKIKEAIIYQEKTLHILTGLNEVVRAGDCMRFLSRLYWYDGNRAKAESWGEKAVELLNGQPASHAKAMALSNMSQLKMLADEREACIFWGKQAIAMAEHIGAMDILCHALNNAGTVEYYSKQTREHGKAILQQSLDIALKNGYHEHAARAYTNFGSCALKTKEYALALQKLDEGIRYCEERDLDSWGTYMLQCKARLYLETGRWQEAADIATGLLKKQHMAAIVKIGALVIAATTAMRRGQPGALEYLIEAKLMALDAMELQRLAPVIVALLEYEWLTGKKVIDESTIGTTLQLFANAGHDIEKSEVAFWLLKTRHREVVLPNFFDGFNTKNKSAILKGAEIWATLGNPYMEALLLCEGGDTEKRKALTIIQNLGAEAVLQKLKQEMRATGVKSIPRGARKSTTANKASLTGREIDVLKLLKDGLQDKEIATRLFISPKTVGHHISSILFKLDVHSRVKAVKEAVQMGILPN